jgi:hypothetical protein
MVSFHPMGGGWQINPTSTDGLKSMCSPFQDQAGDCRSPRPVEPSRGGEIESYYNQFSWITIILQLDRLPGQSYVLLAP